MPEIKKQHGGRRSGAGRPLGTRNRLSKQAVANAAATGELPHEFLLRVARGEEIDGHKPSLGERMAAARDAGPYFAPKLSNVEHGGKDGGPLVVKIIGAAD